MINELLRKWFGLEPIRCESCEILREQLYKCERDRIELTARLLDIGKSEPPTPVDERELKPIMPQYVPWRVRQQMLEAEDHKKAELMKSRQKEIEELEKQVGIAKDMSGPSGGVKFDTEVKDK
jgi:hypothetical protein